MSSFPPISDQAVTPDTVVAEQTATVFARSRLKLGLLLGSTAWSLVLVTIVFVEGRRLDQGFWVGTGIMVPMAWLGARIISQRFAISVSRTGLQGPGENFGRTSVAFDDPVVVTFSQVLFMEQLVVRSTLTKAVLNLPTFVEAREILAALRQYGDERSPLVHAFAAYVAQDSKRAPD